MIKPNYVAGGKIVLSKGTVIEDEQKVEVSIRFDQTVTEAYFYLDEDNNDSILLEDFDILVRTRMLNRIMMCTFMESEHPEDVYVKQELGEKENPTDE